MTKFDTLINILDKIISDAPSKMSKKYCDVSTNDIEKLNQSRSRAFIHLYLKVNFGILDFKEREHFISDGSYDGGIDGYYINKEDKTIYFIQSKFRTNSDNFENKEIDLKEILVMDVNRILDGEECDENDNEYNGKIKQLQREVSQTENISRFSNKVIILANITGVTQNDLKRLTGGIYSEVFNYENCYENLVFPVISGTFFQASELNINIDLSNKNAGSKISYTVLTKKGECEITVLFVPTVELGKIMYKYKNSILKYNPRSYLGLEGKKVNNSIRETIEEKETNEFALFNNGITMLSDETYINEKIGQKNKAQLLVKNPQIINGGQTSYTLSRIYEENINTGVEDIFQNKEVLLKIITLLDNNNHQNKLDLIKDISNATNQQTPVINADKFANDELQVKLQKYLFENYGILYERKRGEFADGIFNGYITQKDIMERNLFFRMYYASSGEITKARQKKLFINQNLSFEELTDFDKLEKTYFAFLCFRKIQKKGLPNQRVDLGTYAKVRAMTILLKPEKREDFEKSIEDGLNNILIKWKSFINEFKKKYVYTKNRNNPLSGETYKTTHYSYAKWFDGETFTSDVKEYFE